MSLLQQAEEWERLALMALDIACEPEESSGEDLAPEDKLEVAEPDAEPQVDTRWWLPRREGLFAGLAA